MGNSHAIFSVNDIAQAKANSQLILTATILQSNTTFFIGAIIVTSGTVVIADGAGNTLISTTTTILLDHFPLRSENGITITGSGYVLACMLPHN
jgi:hypothetical protein